MRKTSARLPCAPAPLLLCPSAAVHSAHEEAAMEEYSLTLGAHLLLWVFPVVLVVVVIAEDLHDRWRSGSER